MISDEKKLTLELYKELGLEVRQFNSETYATNRLMLPPLIIGLLVLYGDVEKFLGVEFQNAEVVHWLVWLGCVLISLMWICNISRLAQLARWHLETSRQCEFKLGLIGHRRVFAIDEISRVSKILRHSVIRFFGFGIYFSLLLTFLLKSIDFSKVLILLRCIVSGETLIALITIIVSGSLSFLIWHFYFQKPFRLSRQTPIKWRYIVSIVSLILIALLILLGIVLFLVNLQVRPDANAHLMQGLRYSAKGDYDNAIEAYTKAIEVKPGYIPAYALRGLEYSAKGDDDQSNADRAKANALRKAQ